MRFPSSDPVVSNVRVTGQPIGELGELPPCEPRFAMFENRWVAMRDRDADCGHTHPPVSKRYGVLAATVSGPIRMTNENTPTAGIEHIQLEVTTDDLAEAQAAFERGAEWVRTGKGP